MAANLKCTRLLAVLLAGGLVLSACGSQEPAEDDTVQAEPPPVIEAAAPETPPADDDALRVYVLDCGTIGVSDLDVFAADGSYAGQSDEFTDTCFLVRHPNGDLLWDLGVPGLLAGQGEQSDGVFTVSLDKSLTRQLVTLGLEPADIEYISLSHSHFDHTGQVDQFQGSTWIVNEDELAAMFQQESDAGEAQFTQFDGLTRVTFTGEFDVFGDGSVKIIAAPGHTPGHSILVVNLPESGPYIFSGDTWHRKESREQGKVPAFNWDYVTPPPGKAPGEVSRASMAMVDALAEELGATVIIQHEPDDIASLPKPPEAIR